MRISLHQIGLSLLVKLFHVSLTRDMQTSCFHLLSAEQRLGSRSLPPEEADGHCYQGVEAKLLFKAIA